MRWSLGVLAGVPIFAGRAPADQAVLKMIGKPGRKITRDDKQPGRPVIGVQLKSKRMTDAELKELKELEQLTFLGLIKVSVTRAGVRNSETPCRNARSFTGENTFGGCVGWDEREDS
jgi:hypothetical protein